MSNHSRSLLPSAKKKKWMNYIETKHFCFFFAFCFVISLEKQSNFVLYLSSSVYSFKIFSCFFFIYYQMSSSQLVRRIIKTAAAGSPSGPYRQEMIKNSEMCVKLSILVKLFKLVTHCI